MNVLVRLHDDEPRLPLGERLLGLSVVPKLCLRRIPMPGKNPW